MSNNAQRYDLATARALRVQAQEREAQHLLRAGYTLHEIIDADVDSETLERLAYGASPYALDNLTINHRDDF